MPKRTDASGEPALGKAGRTSFSPELSPSLASSWEAAYLRFETPAQEVRKFVRRLRKLGADGWPREARIVELFCGRGNGLRALDQLGFSRVFGLDLSPTLLAHSRGAGELVVGDCRELPFADGSLDFAIVQGGLHHLPKPGDLEQTLGEVRRALKPGGFIVAIEPWRTFFLDLVHFTVESRVARRLLPRLDALGKMIDLEGEIYRRWLAAPGPILACLRSAFAPEICRAQLGKLLFVGRRTKR
jgi:SAM-dependent methyltransferase